MTLVMAQFYLPVRLSQFLIVSFFVAARDGSRRIISHSHHGSSRRVCCGSKLPVKDFVPTGYFNRIISAPSFYIDFGSDKDLAPPSRIIDLSIVADNNQPGGTEVTLSWTAPGGDYQQGSASSYEIRTATKVENLQGGEFQLKGILVHPSLTPKPGVQGSPESCVVAVPWPNEFFYYAVVAFDSSGNRGDISNLVAVYINEVNYLYMNYNW